MVTMKEPDSGCLNHRQEDGSSKKALPYLHTCVEGNQEPDIWSLLNTIKGILHCTVAPLHQFSFLSAEKIGSWLTQEGRVNEVQIKAKPAPSSS